MFRLRRWYNQNSKTIWKVTGIVVFFIIVLQVLNYFAGENNSVEYSDLNTGITSDNKYTDLSVSTDKSVLSNEKITSGQSDSIETINDFFAYCNEGKVEEAYELLTDECKEQMYPELKYFKNNYYKTVFNGEKKNISLENWIGDIYKVEIVEDILSSGQYDENSIRQDYITVKKIEDNYKLNINGYIGKEDIDNSIESNNINLNVISKHKYMDYEIYQFKITNNSENPILLDDLLNVKSMYIEDKNGIKYSAYTHDLSLSELLINERETRELAIKYYSNYGSTKTIKQIVFSNVILDYDSYINVKQQNLSSNFIELKVDL